MKTPTGEIDLCSDENAGLEISGATAQSGLYEDTVDLVELTEEPAYNLEDAEPEDGTELWESEEVIRVSGPLNPWGRSARRPMSVCADCGSSSATDEMFCIRCGGPLEESAGGEPSAASGSQCGECSEAVEADEIFCPSCGTVLAET